MAICDWRRTVGYEWLAHGRQDSIVTKSARASIMQINNTPGQPEKSRKIPSRFSLVRFFSNRYTFQHLGPQCADFGTCHREAGVAAPGRRTFLFGSGLVVGQRRNRLPSYAFR